MDTMTMGEAENWSDKIGKVSWEEKNPFFFSFLLTWFQTFRKSREQPSRVYHCFPIFLQLQCCNKKSSAYVFLFRWRHGFRVILVSGIAESEGKYTHNLVKYRQIPFWRIVLADILSVCVSTVSPTENVVLFNFQSDRWEMYS